MSISPQLCGVRTATLEIAVRSDRSAGAPVILPARFPMNPRTWDRVVAQLSRAGYPPIAPYCAATARRAFLTSIPGAPASRRRWGMICSIDGRLGIQRAVLVDTIGGTAACVCPRCGPTAPALWSRSRLQRPERGPQRQAVAARPGTSPVVPMGTRHRARTAGLAAKRRDSASCCGGCGRPTGASDDATYGAHAASFDNPDFVDVVFIPYATASAGRPASRAWSPPRAAGREAAHPACHRRAAWRLRRRGPGGQLGGHARFSAVRTCGG